MPKVSVIMPVYNTEKYVGEAIESILSQSFGDFELIIIDDASTDSSYEICRSYAQRDERIKLSRNPENMGVVKTRNKLLHNLCSESIYIALLDADDIMMKDRLRKQYNFLEKNTSISVLGSDIEIIDSSGEKIAYRAYPHTPKEVTESIFQRSPLAQPSVMIRKRDLEEIGGYNNSYERAQDYELWCRFYDMGYQIINLSQSLTQYRVFPEQGKNIYLKLTLKNTMKIQKKYIFQKKYFSFNNIIYFFIEKMLYFLPGNFVLFLFKKVNYES